MVRTLDCNSRDSWFKTAPFVLKGNGEIPRIQRIPHAKKENSTAQWDRGAMEQKIWKNVY